MWHNPAPVSMEFFLKRRVYIHEGHWLWTKTHDKDGYGVFKLKGIMVKAHRYSYITFIGPIPEDKPFVLHKRGICHIKKCICPDHLYAGTAQDNMDDMNADKRHGKLKFSDEVIETIRIRYLNGESQTKLALEFEMSSTYISAIVNRLYRI